VHYKSKFFTEIKKLRLALRQTLNMTIFKVKINGNDADSDQKVYGFRHELYDQDLQYFEIVYL